MAFHKRPRPVLVRSAVRGVVLTALLLAMVNWSASWVCLGADANNDARIVFLRVRLKADAITLVKATTQPGTLKAPRSPGTKREIQFDLVSNSGAALWSGAMDDPSIERLEYEDPDHPGQIKVKEIKRSEVEFTVRVPWKKEARQVAFYRRGSANQKEIKQNTSPAAAEKSRPDAGKKLLGTVVLPDPEAGP